MKNQYKILVCFLLISNSLFLGAQESRKLQKADAKYNQFEYIDATEIYEEVANSGFESKELFTKLGNSFYFNSKYTKAAKWYAELYRFTQGNVESKSLLRYSQSLKAIGKVKESEKIYNIFLKQYPILSEDFLTASDYLEIIEKNSNRYDIETLDINSKWIDFGSFVQGDTLYFSSTRNHRKSIRKIDTWTNQPFLDIYKTYKKEDASYSNPVAIKGGINSYYHESTPVITKDGKTMYFTRSNNRKTAKKDKKGHSQLKIYRARKGKDNNWGEVENLTINGDNYSNAHPVLSPNEKHLFFVSNRPSSLGQTDIYYVDIFEDEQLGQPTNLGTKVNTKGRESFPFVSQNNELYFSSDGHYGLGGYDIFYLDLKSQEPQLLNVGKPINGPGDDYAFTINSITKKGYYSSNRSFVDDIYGFTETEPIQNLLIAELTGLVTDKETKESIANSIVTIRDQNNNVVKVVETDGEGKFLTKINRYKSYFVRAEKKKYLPEEVLFVKKSEKEVHIELLKKVDPEVIKGADIAKILNVVIYFDFDKSAIREDAKVELEKVIAVLNKYPDIQIDLNSHTDSKGEADYNMRLSNRRAVSTMNYIVGRGVSKERLKAKGFGETKLTNGCIDTIKCSEEEHQKNRRTEFIIVKK